MKAVNKFILKMGKLNLPMACYKAVDDTISVRANEMAKIDGKLYKVQRKPYVVLADGTQQDIDKAQILKGYARQDGEVALFTQDEQSQLLKMGSSREWTINAVIDSKMFSELSFQKDGIIAMVEIDKKKELINKKNLKWLSMLKAGLKDKVIITQILYKNVEYPVVISNHGDNKLLIRFLHYADEIRNIEGQELPKLSAQEEEQAKAFITQFYRPKFDLKTFQNRTEEKVRKLIDNRGTDIKEVKVEETIMEGENPFAVVDKPKEKEELAEI